MPTCGVAMGGKKSGKGPKSPPFSTWKRRTHAWEKQAPADFAAWVQSPEADVRHAVSLTLHEWLALPCEPSRPLYLRLWEGLFFSLWIAQRGAYALQEELAQTLATLYRSVPPKNRGLWIDAVGTTLCAHWERLDLDHMRRFMLLLRFFLAEVFRTLRLGGWRQSDLRETGRAIAAFAAADGQDTTRRCVFLQQVLRVFWSELRAQMEKWSPPPSQLRLESLLALLEPICALLGTSPDENLRRYIVTRILRPAPAVLRASLAKSLAAEALREAAAEMERLAKSADTDRTWKVGTAPRNEEDGWQRPTARCIHTKFQACLGELLAVVSGPAASTGAPPSGALPDQGASKPRPKKKRKKLADTSAVESACSVLQQPPPQPTLSGDTDSRGAAAPKKKLKRKRSQRPSAPDAPALAFAATAVAETTADSLPKKKKLRKNRKKEQNVPSEGEKLELGRNTSPEPGGKATKKRKKLKRRAAAV
eukprot:TRINITY_DN8548_c0_g1_i2.p1 TRINITY_DN8548_c0_g1~~TRINITY_DN8548_c0_g1_i2.p1  ORF type:complete len:478 (+),score=106.43 TRINITY_DN8548_c0_g1_i2:25-1458(+)